MDSRSNPHFGLIETLLQTQAKGEPRIATVALAAAAGVEDGPGGPEVRIGDLEVLAVDPDERVEAATLEGPRWLPLRPVLTMERVGAKPDAAQADTCESRSRTFCIGLFRPDGSGANSDKSFNLDDLGPWQLLLEGVREEL